MIFLLVIYIALILSFLHSIFWKKNLVNLKSYFEYGLSEIRQFLMQKNPQMNYPDLFMPFTPSINLQWTLRDGKMVNVPVIMLVKNDLIVLRPGQIIYCKCKLANSSQIYFPGDEFLPDCNSAIHSSPVFHCVDKAKFAKVLESPFITKYKNMTSLSIMRKYSDYQPIPFCFYQRYSQLFFIINLSISLLIVAFLPTKIFFVEFKNLLIYYYMNIVSKSILTLTILLVPYVWFFCISFSSSRLMILNSRSNDQEIQQPDNVSSISSDTSSFQSMTKNSLLQPQDKGSRNIYLSDFKIKVRTFINQFIMRPNEDAMMLLFTLGSVTCVCCVDKKGVISQTSPAPEKIFFFESKPKSTKLDIDETEVKGKKNSLRKSKQKSEKSKQKMTLEPVVIDVSSNQSSPHLLSFEEIEWERYMNSLKPIGLSILLNNCHPETYSSYAKYADHLTSLSRLHFSRDNQVAVVNHRCLCGLSKLIGFNQGSIDQYCMKHCLACFQPQGSNVMLQKELEFRLLSSEREKNLAYKPQLPMATCYSIVTGNDSTGEYQLMSQGSADLLVSLCTEAWDGKNLIPLKNKDKVAVLDFHNRKVFSSYCTGFSYTPLVDDIFLNLPENSNNFQINNSINRKTDDILQRAEQLDFDLIEREDENNLINTLIDRSLRKPVISKSTRVLEIPHSAMIGNIYEKKINSKKKKENLNEENISLNTDHCKNINNQKYTSDIRIDDDFLDRSQNLEDSDTSNLTNLDDSLEMHLRIQHISPNEGTHVDRSCINVPEVHSTSRKTYLNHPNRFIFRRAYSTSETLSENKYKNSFNEDPDETFDMMRKQVFLGLISFGYEVIPKVTDTIKYLEDACIRFVHFSKENQLRSRVFGERLGLETGWNCHISLGSQPKSEENIRDSSNHGSRLPRSTSQTVRRCYSVLNRLSNRLTNNMSYSSTFSLPGDLRSHKSNVNLKKNILNNEYLTMPVKNLDETTINIDTKPVGRLNHSQSSIDLRSNSSRKEFKFKVYPTSSTSSNSSDSSHSMNRKNSSFDVTDYMLENRSRLPTGIENIRPHLENVDNVPLLVSLFTDCSPTSTSEMIKIMREYGEIVCVIGSCLSIDNLDIFTECDSAIGIFPIIPLTCANQWNGATSCPKKPLKTYNQKRQQTGMEFDVDELTHLLPNLSANTTKNKRLNTSYSVPLFRANNLQAENLAGYLASPFTPIVSQMETAGFNIYSFIQQSHILLNNTYLALLFSLSFTSTVHFYILLVILVTPFIMIQETKEQNFHLINNTSQQMNTIISSIGSHWFDLCREYEYKNKIPLIFDNSLFLLISKFIFCPIMSFVIMNRKVENSISIKDTPIKRDKLFNKERIRRSLLAILFRFVPTTLFCAGVYFFMFIDQCQSFDLKSFTCYMNTSDDLESLKNLVRVQSFVNILFFIYLAIISFSYINFGQFITKFRDSISYYWIILTTIILIIVLALHMEIFLTDFLTDIHIAFLIVTLLWAIFLILFNEFINWMERKSVNAEQRLSRIYFGTKLGMYSPV